MKPKKYEVEDFDGEWAVTQNGAGAYDCDSEAEANDIAAALNQYINETGQDSEGWDQLVTYAGWDKNPPAWMQ